MSKGCEIYHNKQAPVGAIVLYGWKEVAQQHSLLKAFASKEVLYPCSEWTLVIWL